MNSLWKAKRYFEIRKPIYYALIFEYKQITRCLWELHVNSLRD